MKTKTLTLTGVVAALICVTGPISMPLPFSPVPISLTNLAIYFAVYVLGMKKGTLSCVVYILLGLVGLPVFSAFSSGPAKLFGPTGGYIAGYVFMALISGFFIEKWNTSLPFSFAGMLLGTIVCYLLGTVWLAYQTDTSFSVAFVAGVLPFIFGDVIKIIVAAIAGKRVRKRLKMAGLI